MSDERGALPEPLDPAALAAGLSKVRQRRRILWAAIFIYVPGLLIALKMELAGATMAKLFGLWIALLCVAVGLATAVRCPGCGKQFHTNGPTFLPVRRCVHCGLHVCADRQTAPAPPRGEA